MHISKRDSLLNVSSSSVFPQLKKTILDTASITRSINNKGIDIGMGSALSE